MARPLLDLTPEEREARRREQNRISQSAFRKRHPKPKTVLQEVADELASLGHLAEWDANKPTSRTVLEAMASLLRKRLVDDAE